MGVCSSCRVRDILVFNNVPSEELGMVFSRAMAGAANPATVKIEEITALIVYL